MTLNEAKVLLSENNISFESREFENEAAYWRHTMLFPYTKHAKPYSVIALILKSSNGKKHIALQFNAVEGEFLFRDLYFGDYSFEMFDYTESMLADDLMRNIEAIMQGNFVVIVLHDLKNRRWLSDACFDLNEDDDVFGKSGFQKAMNRIHKPKGLIAKLMKSRHQYEIFDWNKYQCIVK